MMAEAWDWGDTHAGAVEEKRGLQGKEEWSEG